MAGTGETAYSEAVAERLLDWEERLDRGEAVTPEDLCRDRPDLLPDLRAAIELLQAGDKMFAPAEGPLPPKIPGYEPRGFLGAGGMGVVYRVWDAALARDAALKVLKLPGESARLRERFLREAQVLAQLKHENVVPVYEADVCDGQPYFVMEFVPHTLADRRQELAAAGPRVVVPLLAKVARAVAAAHAKNILHRDLKPANILLDAAGQPLVADFGLAKLLETAEETLTAEQTPREGLPPRMTPTTPVLPTSVRTSMPPRERRRSAT